MQSVLGLAGKLAGELLSPVFQKYITERWGQGSQDEFDKLKETMLAINAVLLDAEERQQTNNQIQLWLREIKLVYYDVDDLLQEVTTKALKEEAKSRKRNREDTTKNQRTRLTQEKKNQRTRLTHEKNQKIRMKNMSFSTSLGMALVGEEREKTC